MRIHAEPHDQLSAKESYERRDLSPRVIGLFLAGLVVVTGLVLLLIWGLFDYYATRQARADRPSSPLADVRQIPPEPRLQVSGAADLAAFRAKEEAELRSYGWVDRNAGTVRIPIDRTMDLLLQRGLPATPQKAGTP
jgi:hypothetical protein